MSKILKIKNVATGDIRRISQSSWMDLVSLDKKLNNLFASDLPRPYVLQYRDEDGDLVSITSTIEFLEAAQSAERLNRNRPVLSLNLCKAESVASSINLANLDSIALSDALSKWTTTTTNTTTPTSTRTSSSSSSNNNNNNNASNRLKGRIYIDSYAPTLEQSIRKLVRLSYGWIQSRDTLIQFGGNFNDSLMALQQLGARPAQNRGVSRYYFSDSFAQKIRDLVDAGFPTKTAVQTLVRFGGNAQSAALELAGVFQKEEKAKHCDRCDSYLKVSRLSSGAYSTGWYCDRCRKNGSGARWKCPTCEFDVCFKCEPKPHTLHQKNQSNNSSSTIKNTSSTTTTTTTTTSANNNPDFSLPDSLRSTVLTLEKMGFTDRDKNIELLVKYGGDSTKVAMHLTEEVRRKEEQSRARARAEARRREAQIRKQQRIEAEKRRQEQARLRKLQNEQEKNRGEAAKLMIKSPEKIATDIHRLQEMGYDTISATTSLLNAGGDIESALEELLKLQ